MVLFHIDVPKIATATLSLDRIGEGKVRAELSENNKVFFSKESENQSQLLADAFKAVAVSLGNSIESASIVLNKYQIPENKWIEDATEGLLVSLATSGCGKEKASASFTIHRSYKVKAKATTQETLCSMVDRMIQGNVPAHYLEFLINIGERFDKE